MSITKSLNPLRAVSFTAISGNISLKLKKNNNNVILYKRHAE